jgi:hypothetical protein
VIVTAKWLTGFDAKNLGVMYLDKPLRAHTLFQAITRTNHTWTNPETGQEKTAGLVIDYIGLGAEIATGSVLSVRLPDHHSCGWAATLHDDPATADQVTRSAALRDA